MAVTFRWYDISTQYVADGTWEAGSPQVSIAAQPLTLILLTTSYAFSAAHKLLSDVSANEIAAGNGYNTGGLALATVALTQAAPVSNLTAANTTWTAGPGSIAAWQHAVCYINATVNGHIKPVLFDVDAGGAQGPTTSGLITGVNWNATGVFQITHN